MKNYHTEQGVTTPIIALGIAIIIGAGAAFYFVTRTTPPVEAPAQESPFAKPTKDTFVEQDTTTPTYSGAVLAGTSAPLLDFNQADFEAAQASGKLIVLYFYANWCPICRAEFPKAEAAFDRLTTDQVVGFRVNFNDDETDADEVALAREHGVAYQHTKVFIQNDAQLLKSPETWETSRYLTEINNTLAQ